ncbi:response regulator [Paenibacillus guangzhouensis]|uniref:response regulator n=1 Tax=Paenibacillus guangzhouensis TaxID=1473112 RepID=UPI001266CAFF|nr:response regulator [Paenibacillus guangzhouensis]
MYTLLIVDDQPDLVTDISTMIPWKEIGIETIYPAYSAQEALEIVQVNPVDIVITDIRMPGMSGLELIEQIRATWSKIKCILLTGYDDFNYAKQALKCQASDYLLKPVEDRELIHAVNTAIRQIEEEWLHISSAKQAHRSLQEHLPLLRSHLLQDLLQGTTLNFEDISDKLKQFELPFHAESEICLMLIRKDDFDRYSIKDIDLLEFSICNITEELFGDLFHLWYGKDNHEYLIFVIGLKKEIAESTQQEEKHRELLERKVIQLQHYVNLYMKGSISVLISSFGALYWSMQELYEISLNNYRQYIGRDSGLLVTSIPTLQVRDGASTLQSLYALPSIAHLLEAGQWSKLEQKLESIFSELTQKWNDSHEHIMETYFVIVSSIIYSAHKGKYWLSQIMRGEYETFVNGPHFHTTAQLKEWTQRVIEKYKLEIANEVNDSRSGIVKQVHEYATANLSEATLQSIASYVYLNPSYLSKIYKVETGEGISEYLTRLKMERAAQRLSNTNEKIYEISTDLGYSKTSYFIKLFKENFGITPQEYRNSCER